ncbi:LapA family protein [Sphingomonas crusticola]|uniref:LapA family protein n=1 Tax=Sphingomonas crusticola TaxID=1697973 RepID=UPI000E22637F|nr:LapA family protein [Sphingomonas crusticola]
MAFLRTLFWIVVTVIVVVFSFRNWSAVTINLFGDMQADVKLPVLLLIAFLIGFVPLYIWYRVFKWRHVRKLAMLDRAVSPTTVPVPPAPQPAYADNLPLAAARDPFQAD